MSHSYLRRIYLRLAGVVMLVVVLALAASSYFSHSTFERALVPEMGKKIATVGASIRSLVLKAVEHGMDFKVLYGIEQKFDEVKRETPDVAYMAITDTRGVVLHQRFAAPAGAESYFRDPQVLASMVAHRAVAPPQRVGDQFLVSLPIESPQGVLGMLHIGVDVRFVDNIVLDMMYDVLVVLVVALFFTLELLNFMAGARLERSLKALGDTIERGIGGNFAKPLSDAPPQDFSAVSGLLDAVLARVNAGFAALAHEVEARRLGPAHERPPGLGVAQHGVQELAREFRFGAQTAETRADDGQLGKLRAPLFVFILAEELTRSFLPTYVKELLVPIPWLAPEIVVGLPIMLFMLIVALGQPYLGAYSDRVGPRRAMLIGAGIAALGFVATALANNVLDLLLWRSLCAVGYAMVFSAGQGYVLEHATSVDRPRSFALFVGAIMAATVCGPSIGGILADNIGERATFGVAALLALGSMAAIRLMPGPRAADPQRVSPGAPSLREIISLLGNRRFLAVTAFAAMPAKILLTGVCFYLVPLYMVAIGSTQAMTGRILMAYAVLMVVVGPITAGLANSRDRMKGLVAGGLVVSGLGGALLLAGGGITWVFAAIVLVGLGQSMSISAQSALVGEFCSDEVDRIGESAVYGVYRLLERLGNALGPLIAAVLVLNFDYRTGFVAIGGLAALCGLAFLLATRSNPRPALVTVA